MNEEDFAFLYRKAKADGMRDAARLFKIEKPDICKYINELAERTEKGEA